MSKSKMDDDSDILSFGHTKKISFKAALKDVRSSRPKYSKVVASPDTSSAHSEFSSEEEERYCGYKRRHNLGGTEGSLASRLIHHQEVLSSEDSDDEDSYYGLGEKKKARKMVPSPPSLCDSFSSSPSPEPSPPVVGSLDTPIDKTSKRVLNKASDALNQLMYSTYSTPGSESSYDLNESLTSSATRADITIRVRYRGRIRKYTISMCDPLSSVSSRLAKEVRLEDSSHFLLSLKDNTLSETGTPLSLGLTTTDIIDAIPMSDSVSASSADASRSSGGNNQVKIKIQTSKKSINYSIARTDPLKKAMDAFAKDIGVPVKKLSFSFDGEPIRPKQTAEDLEMEDEDCIDARL